MRVLYVHCTADVQGQHLLSGKAGSKPRLSGSIIQGLTGLFPGSLGEKAFQMGGTVHTKAQRPGRGW